MEHRRMVVLVNTALLSALSTVLMMVEFPLPMFPPWLKFGFSDVPGLIGGFAFGPVYAATINVIKNLLNIVLKGPTFGGVGEAANLLMGCAVAVTASMIYRRKPTAKRAATGLLCGLVLGTCAAVVANVYMLVPAAGISVETLAGVMTGLTSALNLSHLSPIAAYAFVGVIPFNIIKMGAEVLLTLLIYRRVIPVINGTKKESSR